VQAWTGTTMEPFVIGSLWGNLSDDNKGTLVSTGAASPSRTVSIVGDAASNNS